MKVYHRYKKSQIKTISERVPLLSLKMLKQKTLDS